MADQLFAEANKARQRVWRAEGDLRDAKRDFHEAVKKLSDSGRSLRSIAEGLEMSYQRIHQIVEACRPRWSMSVRHQNSVRACSFCGRGKKEAEHLVAGPNIHICDRCLGIADNIARGEYDLQPPFIGRIDTGEKSRCGFCQSKHSAKRPLIGSADARICMQCIELSKEILQP